MQKPAPRPALTTCCGKTDTLLTIYGIPNCDKCRAARKWFSANGLDHIFHDLRADGLTSGMLDDWHTRAPLEGLLNKRSRSWKELDEAERAADTPAALKKLLVRHPTLIKRPLVDTGSALLVGYDERSWQELLN